MSTRASFTSVTLRDVAGRSGVSITTVSRILNGRESGVPIRDETRQRVLAVAAELGYKPNLLARGLRGSRSSLIGVIARDVSDPFHIQVLQGVNEVTRSRDYRLFLGHVDYRPDVALTYGSMFERSHADGILILGDLAGGDEALADLTSQHRFVVGCLRSDGAHLVPRRLLRQRRGHDRWRSSHLWGLGHRRIVCVFDPGTADQRQRAELYEWFMADRGQAGSDRARTRRPNRTPEPSYRLGRELLAGRGPADAPSAIFATSDTIAIGLLQAAYQAGVVVPDRLSIVGFDNIDIAAFTIPPLTTVSQSGVEMGRTAATLLLDMIDHDRAADEIDDVVLAPTLVVRESSAAPYAGLG